tara:strand:+ start:663 stop:2498 length:1836 start_codon:yes stop_codon:yes gene_type:complete
MKKIPALLLIVIILSSVAMASTWEITTGTQFISDNNMSIEWLSDAGPSEVLSDTPTFTSNSIEFYDTNFTSFGSDPIGDIGVYHNLINGTWVNLTVANLGVGNSISVNTTVQEPPVSPFTFLGNGLTQLHMNTQIDATNQTVDFAYASTAAGTEITLTPLRWDGANLVKWPNETLGAINAATGVGLAVNTTTADGVLVLKGLPNTYGSLVDVQIAPLGYVEIRSAQEPYPLLTGGVEVTFYEELPLGSTQLPLILYRTTDAQGRIGFTDIESFAEREFMLQVKENDAPGYFPRVVLIPSLLDQSTMYLVPTNATRGTVSSTIQISDQTGSYSGEGDDVTLYVEKAINRTAFDTNITTNNPGRFEIMVSERVGNTLNLNSTFIYSERYRIRVTNARGDERQLGSWTATRDGELSVLQIQLFNITSPDITEGYQANSTFSNNAIMFGFIDTGPTQTPQLPGSSNLVVNITSMYNDTHPVIYSATACPVACGEFIVNATGAMSGEDLAQAPFKVSWSVVKDGQTIGGSFVVGPNTLTSSPNVSQATKNLFVMAVLVILGGTVAALSSPGLAILTLTAATVLFMLTNLLDAVVAVPVILVAAILGIMAFYRQGGR